MTCAKTPNMLAQKDVCYHCAGQHADDCYRDQQHQIYPCRVYEAVVS